jgi:hypothetical protein
MTATRPSWPRNNVNRRASKYFVPHLTFVEALKHRRYHGVDLFKEIFSCCGSHCDTCGSCIRLIELDSNSVQVSGCCSRLVGAWTISSFVHGALQIELRKETSYIRGAHDTRRGATTQSCKMTAEVYSSTTTDCRRQSKTMPLQLL